MYKDNSNEKDETYFSEKDRVLAWTKDVAKSTAIEAPPRTPQSPKQEVRYIEREPPRVTVNQIVMTPPVIVTRTRPETRPKDEISTKAVIGTVLGATAGAVVAYAMTKAQTEDSHTEPPNRVTHRLIEAPVTYELVQRDSQSHARAYTLNPTIAPQPLVRPHVDDVIPRSEHLHPSPHSVTQCHVENVTRAPYATQILVADSGKSRASGASVHARTARQSELIPITEVRSAKDVPLPPSRVTSLVTARGKDEKAGRSSVSPKESVSQVSTRRSGKGNRSRHDSSHDSRHGKDLQDGDSRLRTSRK